MGMSSVFLALVGWPLLMAAMTAFLPIRRIVMISIIGGNLFLPQAALNFPGFPNYTKPLAAGLGALVAAAMVAAPQLLSWRPRPVDLFFISFLVAPGISSLLNGLGGYDAASTVVNRLLEWGVAYWVGRTLFDHDAAIRDLALGFVVGGLVYVPFCVWESVMSPQLHLKVYGFRTSPFGMTKRWGGWRPTVFMQHGLAVAGWMASSSVVAWILWRSKAVLKIAAVPMFWVTMTLVLVTIGLRSTGAAILMLGMIAACEFVQATRMRALLLSLILLPAGYIVLRVAGWNGGLLVEWSSLLGEGRAGSLNMRLENDAMIVSRAMEQPIFGWGGWGRWRVHDEFGRDITVSDSWWGILLGMTGIFGLVAAYGSFMAPMFLLVQRKSTHQIFEGSRAAAWAVGMAILLFILDTLANAMPNTSFMLASGAMAAFVVRRPRAEKRVRASGAGAGERGLGGSSSIAADSDAAPPRPRTIDLR